MLLKLVSVGYQAFAGTKCLESIKREYKKTENHILLMIPLIVQIYIYSRMSEAEQYISDNLITVLRNLSYNGEYTLVQSLLEFSYIADLEKLEELHNYFTKRNNQKMTDIIQDRMNRLIFARKWE